MASRPHLIAIAGCSCSGKTELSQKIAAALAAPVLPVDAYYRELDYLSLAERAQVNFDEPAAIDAGLLLADVARLAKGEPAERPVYDFTTHTRAKQRIVVPASAYVVIEGLFALYWEHLRLRCATRVFIDLDQATCYARRLERDVRERGRTPESVEKQFLETVRPMAGRYVLPTRAFADVVVSGRDPLEKSAQRVLWHVETVRDAS